VTDSNFDVEASNSFTNNLSSSSSCTIESESETIPYFESDAEIQIPEFVHAPAISDLDDGEFQDQAKDE
jgi:hypothetical protein